MRVCFSLFRPSEGAEWGTQDNFDVDTSLGFVTDLSSANAQRERALVRILLHAISNEGWPRDARRQMGQVKKVWLERPHGQA